MEEASLVERCRAGDRAAFDLLVTPNAATIRGIVARYIQNPADVEDVVQRALFRAFERIGSFRGDSAFGTWLCRIAINVALNHLDGERNDAVVPLEDDALFTNGLRTEKLVANEVWRKIQQHLAELPSKQRLVFELRVFHEFSFDEIAAVAGCTEESARSNYRHALSRLRAFLPGLSG